MFPARCDPKYGVHTDTKVLLHIVLYHLSLLTTQVTVTDSQGLTGTENMTIVVGEPFSMEMSPKSGTWVVGDTLEVIGHTTFVLLPIKRCTMVYKAARREV